MYKNIYDSEEIMVDYYNDGKPMIRVSQFKDNHFRDEHFAELPVDVVEVAHGRWERNKNDKIVCSVCKNEPLLDDFGHWFTSDYCPHCGAKMDGDGNG